MLGMDTIEQMEQDQIDAVCADDWEQAERIGQEIRALQAEQAGQ